MAPPHGGALDVEWLNDDTEFQRNFVHGSRNPSGLHLRYRLDGEHVVTDWTPGEHHMGFPGFVHGGLIAAALDDVMNRCSVLHRRWMLTGRMETRYRRGVPLGERLRLEGWITRISGRMMQAASAMSLPDDTVVAEATGTYLPIPDELLERMLETWPGFARYNQRG